MPLSLIEIADRYIKSAVRQFNIDDKPNELLSVAACARLLNVDRGFMQQLLLDPALPRIQIKVGGQIKIPKNQLLSYIAERSETWFKY